MKKLKRELQRLLPPGFTIGHPVVPGSNPGQRRRVRTGNGHFCIIDPDGQPVVNQTGAPIKFSSSPSPSSAQHELDRCKEIAAQLHEQEAAPDA